MYYFIKDFIVALFAPTALIGLCFLLGLLAYSLKRRKLAKAAGITGLVLFTLFSLNPVTEGLLHLYEGQYPALDITSVNKETTKFVVVLSGGYTIAKQQPLASQLGPFTLPRVVEGVRLWHALPHTKLVFSGKGWEIISEAEAMANMAHQLGVPRESIILDVESSNTADHPVKLKPILQNNAFILVTSATHMPRAMENFKLEGLIPKPAPVGHLLTGEYKLWHNKPPYPRGDNLAAMDVLYYEWMGMILNKVRGSP